MHEPARSRRLMLFGEDWNSRTNATTVYPTASWHSILSTMVLSLLLLNSLKKPGHLSQNLDT